MVVHLRHRIKNKLFFDMLEKNALVVELVDTAVLETVALSLASSSLARGTNETIPTEDRLALLKGILAYGSNYHSKLQNDPRYSVMDPALWCTHNRWTVNYVQSNPQLR